MKTGKRILLSGAVGIIPVLMSAVPASAALLVADGFDYTAGTNALAGNSDTDFTPNPATWQLTGTAAYSQSVATGNLTYPGGGAPPQLTGGNSAQIIVPSASNSAADRIQLATPASSGVFNDTLTPNTTLFYSLTMKVTSISALATTAAGSFIAGFNNAVGASGTVLSTAGAALSVRRDTATSTTYHLGIAQNVGTRIFGTASYTPGDVLFIVAEYSIGNAANTDTSSLYVFDGTSGDSIPLTQPGSPTVFSANSADIAGSLQSFFLRDQGTALAATVDDVRVATTWTEAVGGVVAAPEPTSLSLLAIGAVATLSRRRRQPA